MNARIRIGEREYTADLATGRSIAIPLHFDGPQPNAYDVPHATARHYEDGGFVGDTRLGGSCNFETITLTPHCNGTHTECVGHIAHERIAVDSVLQPGLLPATVISVTPEAAMLSPESYALVKDEEDRIITSAALQQALADADPAFLEALIIRTLPNDPAKRSRQYAREPAPFFSIEAMHVINALGVEHLLADIPSLDRAGDEGRLSAHHLFWEVEQGSHDVDPARHSMRTVTELIYVPDDIPDGRCLLDLQIAPFMADAAPSRPVVFGVSTAAVQTDRM